MPVQLPPILSSSAPALIPEIPEEFCTLNHSTQTAGVEKKSKALEIFDLQSPQLQTENCHTYRAALSWRLILGNLLMDARFKFVSLFLFPIFLPAWYSQEYWHFQHYVTRKKSFLGQHIEYGFHALVNSCSSMPRLPTWEEEPELTEAPYLPTFLTSTSRYVISVPGFLETREYLLIPTWQFMPYFFENNFIYSELIPEGNTWEKGDYQASDLKFRNIETFMFFEGTKGMYREKA